MATETKFRTESRLVKSGKDDDDGRVRSCCKRERDKSESDVTPVKRRVIGM